MFLGDSSIIGRFIPNLQGRIGFISWAAGAIGSSFLFSYLGNRQALLSETLLEIAFSAPVHSVASVIFWTFFVRRDWATSWRASFLGWTLVSGMKLSMASDNGLFGWYVVIMSLFHYGEFLATAVTNPDNLSTDSFLLNHSVAYGVAAAVSWVEFGLELHFLPVLKSLKILSQAGIVVCLFGDVLRKLAMFHAGRSFNHIVQSSKREDHVLVTSGVFALVRHPSYVGWFLWSVGTQLVLLNPICILAYAAVSWKFFSERIYVEEYTLLKFFGEEYFEYQRRVPVGIPFIRGYEGF